MNILIVEDEKGIVSALQETLSRSHYLSSCCYDGESGLEEALSGIYDVIILDVMLPRLDGFSVLSSLRKQGISTPVIMLTARTSLDDRVEGLDRGADYYLAKPFEVCELLAIIRAVSRRKSEGLALDEPAFGDLKLDLGKGTLCSGGEEVRLSARELALLELLISADGAILSKEQIARRIWGYECDAEYNNVEVYVSFLRKKLAFVRSSVMIRSVRGLGYHLEAK